MVVNDRYRILDNSARGRRQKSILGIWSVCGDDSRGPNLVLSLKRNSKRRFSPSKFNVSGKQNTISGGKLKRGSVGPCQKNPTSTKSKIEKPSPPPKPKIENRSTPPVPQVRNRKLAKSSSLASQEPHIDHTRRPPNSDTETSGVAPNGEFHH